MAFSHIRRSTALTLVVSLTALMVACTAKDRDTRMAQGQTTEGLLKISDYQNKSYPIKTLEALSKTESHLETSAFQTQEISKDSKRDWFPVVKYESNAPFLKAIGDKKWVLIGRENTEGIYSFFIQLTDKQLVVYKKAKGADLSGSEKTMAGKPYEGDTYLVPQFYMGISLKKKEKVKNPDNEETNVESLYEAKTLAEAEFFEPDLTSAAMVSPASREFVFDKDYFSGEWFFSAVMVSSLDAPAGLNLNSDFELREASRIQFEIDQYRLSGKNSNVDEADLDEKGKVDIESNDVIFIPADSVDFQYEAAASNKKTYKEETLDEKNPKSPHWTKRRFIKLNFSNAWGYAAAVSKSGIANDSSLVDLVAESDYLGFTVFYRVTKTTVRYSLRRASEPVPVKDARIAFNTDMDKKFGYFTTKKAFKPGAEHVRFSDYSKNYFLNRFYPARNKEKPNTIVYHFSTSSPKEPTIYRDSAREAIKQWNELFQKTSGISVELDESKDVDLGDIRYNVINLVYEKKQGGGLLGYGPSISDTKSGEIISATSNIYVTPFIHMTVRQLRDLVYREIGKIQDDQILDPATLSQKISAELAGWDYSSEPLSYVLQRNESIRKDTGLSASEKGKPVSSCHSFDLSYKEVRKEAVEKCQDDLYKYVQQVNEANKNRAQGVEFISTLPKTLDANGKEISPEYEALLSCANKVAYAELVHTTLHELGHNFGLRHNFAASADVRNFIKDFSTSSQVERGIEAREKKASSSVMDYLSQSAKVSATLGAYDEAAIRFGYAAQVEEESSTTNLGDYSEKFIQLDTAKSIAENERAQGKVSRKFKFCTDEHVTSKYEYGQFSEEPLCFRFDWGATATEVAYNLINDMNNGMSHGRNRYDLVRARFHDADGLEGYTVRMYLEPLLRVYAGWRGLLAYQIKDRTKINLFDFTEAELAEVVKAGLKNPNKAERERFADFYSASQLIAEFMMRLASLPAKQCLAWDANGKMHSGDFEQLKETAALEQIKISDCSDKRVIALLGIQGTPEELAKVRVISTGFNYEDHSYTEEVAERPDWWTADIVGVGKLVNKATELLRDADAFSISFYNVKLNPIVLNEPKILSRAIDLMRERMLFGIRAADLIPSYSDKEQFLPLFRSTVGPTTSLATAIAVAVKEQDGARTRLTYQDVTTRDEIPANNPIWSDNDPGSNYKFTTARMENSITVEFLRKKSQLDNLEKLTVSTITARRSFTDVEQQAKKLAEEMGTRLVGDISQLPMNLLVKEYLQQRMKVKSDSIATRLLDIAFRSLYENPQVFQEIESGKLITFAENTETLTEYMNSFASPVQKGTIGEVMNSAIQNWKNYLVNREEYKHQREGLNLFFSLSGIREQ